MRKTFGITKYESRWQLLRAAIKGYSKKSLQNSRLGSKNVKNVHNFFF